MQPVDWRTRRPGFQRRSYCNGSHSNRSLASPAFGGCSFLRDSRAERHSAMQRSPRSHSSASLRSRSAVALSSWARASLRYRIARALLMASQIPRNRRRIQLQEKDLVPSMASPCRAPDSFLAADRHSTARQTRTHQQPPETREMAMRRPRAFGVGCHPSIPCEPFGRRRFVSCRSIGRIGAPRWC